MWSAQRTMNVLIEISVRTPSVSLVSYKINHLPFTFSHDDLILGCRNDQDCENGETCESNKCTNNPGKVLLTEFNLYTSCPDCSSGSKEAEVTLVGEILIDKTTGQLKDNSCTFNRGISQFFLNDRVSYNSQTALGGCWKVHYPQFSINLQ